MPKASGCCAPDAPASPVWRRTPNVSAKKMPPREKNYHKSWVPIMTRNAVTSACHMTCSFSLPQFSGLEAWPAGRRAKLLATHDYSSICCVQESSVHEDCQWPPTFAGLFRTEWERPYESCMGYAAPLAFTPQSVFFAAAHSAPRLNSDSLTL